MTNYNPTDARFLTVANSLTNRGTKNIKLILDIDNNVFYTLDDNDNFKAMQYQPPTLSFYISGNTSGTTIAQSNTFYEFVSNQPPVLKYQSQLNNGLSLNTSTGKIEYSGETQWFSVAGHIELSSGNNNEIEIALFKNGQLEAGSISSVITSSGGKTSSIPGMAVVELSSGDIIDIRVMNKTATTAITVKALNVLIQAI